jgi:hypothetical protein
MRVRDRDRLNLSFQQRIAHEYIGPARGAKMVATWRIAQRSLGVDSDSSLQSHGLDAALARTSR